MYGSYGSYGSYGMSSSSPMDIQSSSLRSDNSCAFPSWPRRASLSESDCSQEERATSFLSDDDLFLSSPFEEDRRSVSSTPSSLASPGSQSPRFSETHLAEMEKQRGVMQRDLARFLAAEKERRRQVPKKHRRSTTGTKKSPKGKVTSMAPISEASE